MSHVISSPDMTLYDLRFFPYIRPQFTVVHTFKIIQIYFCCCCFMGVSTQGLTLAKLGQYHMSHSENPSFVCWVFQDTESWTVSPCESQILILLNYASWENYDYRSESWVPSSTEGYKNCAFICGLHSAAHREAVCTGSQFQHYIYIVLCYVFLLWVEWQLSKFIVISPMKQQFLKITYLTSS
jgi:hypothetical protein